MNIRVHHQPAKGGLSWDMHVWQAAWDGNSVWDPHSTLKGGVVDFELPDISDPRKLQFKYRSTDTMGRTTWEPDDFIRRVFQTTPTEIWTFDFSGRILYQSPYSAGVVFNPGDVLTFHVITQNRFRGGQIYAWNPYDSANPSAYFPETARDDTTSVSTFAVTLASWMTAGFHLKLMRTDSGRGSDTWEPDASNRVWRPCDGALLWMKSGQNDLRSQALSLTALPLEVLFPATMLNAPALTLQDVVEDMPIQLTSPTLQTFAGSPLFRVAAYSAKIYPGASYILFAQSGEESAPIMRPFPANPADLTAVSRFALGAGAWLGAFPTIVSTTLSIQPLPVTTFTSGVSVQVSIGNASVYQRVPAERQADGSWSATLAVVQNTTTAVQLLPPSGIETKPYDWIDTRRFFTPSDSTTTFFTTEGVYGMSARGKTQFADPMNRKALMEAVFGSAIVGTGIFAARELPHGVTLLGADVYFVLHAPHAVWAALVLVVETAPGGPIRSEIPMALTRDTLYWWCKISGAMAAPGTRYHFLLNDDLEVMDPAARAVLDRGDFSTSLGDDPSDPGTSWSQVLDVASVMAKAHVQPWRTLGWESLLIYEIHAKRFTDLDVGTLTPLDVLADELKPINRLGQSGYLLHLPVTVFELMPVSEFSSAASWGYNPAFYFAIDEFYGGAPALAGFVNAAHQNGRGVMLDVVYNHSLGSPLMRIAPDVYRNGDYDGDRMNCGHPMVGEFLRQATVYLCRTFGLDGFRFDDTKTIVIQCQGGWQFLDMIRSCIRASASAEGLPWPYCVAENADNGWNISDPQWGVMDGQWDIDEAYRLRYASYDSWHPGWDDSGPLQNEMDNPQYGGRPFSQATRFGESHDMVSAQDPANLRIAARPPFGQGLQMAKALGTLTLLSNGVPMLFMGQEIGETQSFSFDNNGPVVNPQNDDLPPLTATNNTRVLAWFRLLMGLRNDPAQGLRGEANYQVVKTGNRTMAFTCGAGQSLFVVVTFGTSNNRQDSSWLGLPEGVAYKEIFNSSWPVFQVEFEQEQSNGGYNAQIYSGQILNLPTIGAVVLQRI